MTVLSLFDGISCGHIALERAGIKINKYKEKIKEPTTTPKHRHKCNINFQIKDQQEDQCISVAQSFRT